MKESKNTVRADSRRPETGGHRQCFLIAGSGRSGGRGRCAQDVLYEKNKQKLLCKLGACIINVVPAKAKQRLRFLS